MTKLSVAQKHALVLASGDKLEQFHLSFLRPIANQPGELVFEMVVVDHTITDAVAYARDLVKGTDLIVIQTASLIRDKVIDPATRAAVLKKLGLYEPEGYDRPKAELEAPTA